MYQKLTRAGHYFTGVRLKSLSQAGVRLNFGDVATNMFRASCLAAICMVALIAEPAHATFVILGTKISAKTAARVSLKLTESYSGETVQTPVDVVYGGGADALCVISGIHGDEVNGIEATRRFRASLDPNNVTGTIIMVPIANPLGFRAASRYLPDRRDLNRAFPGDHKGSLARRIAGVLFKQVVKRCHAVIDLHTGSLHRNNAPQVRANMNVAAVQTLAYSLGLPILAKPAAKGSLRSAATKAGIATVTIEAGEANLFNERSISAMVGALQRAASSLQLYSQNPVRTLSPQPAVFNSSQWVRANHGGIHFGGIEPGATVCAGAALGYIVDPLSDQVQTVNAPFDGWILGAARNQIVLPGYALIHVARLQKGRPCR